MSDLIRVKEKTYESVPGGIMQLIDNLIVQFTDTEDYPAGTLEEIEEAFSGAEKIEILNNEDLFAVYNGYSKVSSIQKSYVEDTDPDGAAETRARITVALQKPDRIDALEEAVDMLAMAILEEGE